MNDLYRDASMLAMEWFSYKRPIPSLENEISKVWIHQFQRNKSQILIEDKIEIDCESD